MMKAMSLASRKNSEMTEMATLKLVKLHKLVDLYLVALQVAFRTEAYVDDQMRGTFGSGLKLAYA